ncbi:MAG: hypothetical protein JWO97_1221, partial [Acidobacteria bacterium]|nr:hypothetical protein [Acidobacteriota bacterium]
MKPALLLVLLLAASTARADSADLELRVETSSRARGGQRSYGNVFVVNHGPDVARNVVVTMSVSGVPGAQLPCVTGTCNLGDIQPLSSPSVQAIIDLPRDERTFPYHATVQSDTPDPNPANDVGDAIVEVSNAPDVSVYVRGTPTLYPGQPFDFYYGVFNQDGYATAHDVVATLVFPDSIGVKSLPSNCVAFPGRVECTKAELLDGKAGTFPAGEEWKLTLLAPPQTDGGRLMLSATVHARENDFYPGNNLANATVTLYRTFTVTTSDDDGSGSLRAAIGAMNASCSTSADPCAVVFNITTPSENPWKTIRVATPLPDITARNPTIDGSTQLTFAPANPPGPPIELTGGGMVDGAGLVVADAGCSFGISHLVINGFRGAGVRVTKHGKGATLCFDPSPEGIHDNFIGTDATGTAARPNYRGVETLGAASIHANVISGNERSGIFALSSSLRVFDNRIGLRADKDEPLPNGASGIFVSREAGTFGQIQRNVIAFNGEMGIAIEAGTMWPGTYDNRIWRNGGLPIDIGLDGPTTSDTFGAKTPVIVSATYDRLQETTTITGTPTARPVFDQLVTIYASDSPTPSGFG